MKKDKKKYVLLSAIAFVFSTILLYHFFTNKPKSLGAVKTKQATINFYVDCSHDSAVLGFWIKGPNGFPRYFPIYCSPTGEIGPVELEVYLSNANEIWIFSSWEGYKKLAYYPLGSDYCITKYGKNPFSKHPIPEKIGENGVFPKIDDFSKMEKIKIIKYK